MIHEHHRTVRSAGNRLDAPDGHQFLHGSDAALRRTLFVFVNEFELPSTENTAALIDQFSRIFGAALEILPVGRGSAAQWQGQSDPDRVGRADGRVRKHQGGGNSRTDREKRLSTTNVIHRFPISFL